ncbi:MAG: hypothetical protein GY913_00515 [Proteobacteria bacterium]|nr:hypothetical protein [Pseudomonadota bacterium]MCP4915380.1 hypothetical protein [Pseudomonadota bacterium]
MTALDRLRAAWVERKEPAAVGSVVVAVALVLLAVLSALDPGLRFVDFLQFSDRAHQLRVGAGLSHPLYPVGYPAVLSLLQAVFGDVLFAGRVISVAAGVGAVWAAVRLLGPWAGLWLLVQVQTVLWGVAEGTDLLAAGWGLGAIAAAHSKRPWLAGLLAGAACLTRYTGIAVVPVIVVAAGWRPLVTWAAVVAPQLVLALVTGGPMMDQGSNMAIGHGPPGQPAGPFAQWLDGLRRATPHVLGEWPVWLGLAGLVVGAVKKDRRAWMLAAYAALHTGGIALAFANPRLALPATSALALGAFWLVPRRWLIVPAVLLACVSVPRALETPPEAARVRPLVEAAEPGRYLSSDPWFHTVEDGWLRAGTPVWVVGEPHTLSASKIRAFAAQSGHTHIALDQARAGRSPGLRALMAEPPEGFTVVAEEPGQVLLRID